MRLIREKIESDFEHCAEHNASTTFDLKTTRTLADMKPVLYNAENSSSAVAYFGYQNLRKGTEPLTNIWHNLTIFSPRKLGSEFNKNFGHYQKVRELYQTYHGMAGHLIGFQASWTLVLAGRGDIVPIPENCYHFIYNFGDDVLVTGDLVDNDLRTLDENKANYRIVEVKKGARFYFLWENQQIKVTLNQGWGNGGGSVSIKSVHDLIKKKFSDLKVKEAKKLDLSQILKSKTLSLARNEPSVSNFLGGDEQFSPLLTEIYK